MDTYPQFSVKINNSIFKHGIIDSLIIMIFNSFIIYYYSLDPDDINDFPGLLITFVIVTYSIVLTFILQVKAGIFEYDYLANIRHERYQARHNIHMFTICIKLILYVLSFIFSLILLGKFALTDQNCTWYILKDDYNDHRIGVAPIKIDNFTTSYQYKTNICLGFKISGYYGLLLILNFIISQIGTCVIRHLPFNSILNLMEFYNTFDLKTIASIILIFSGVNSVLIYLEHNSPIVLSGFNMVLYIFNMIVFSIIFVSMVLFVLQIYHRYNCLNTDSLMNITNFIVLFYAFLLILGAILSFVLGCKFFNTNTNCYWKYNYDYYVEYYPLSYQHSTILEFQYNPNICLAFKLSGGFLYLLVIIILFLVVKCPRATSRIYGNNISLPITNISDSNTASLRDLTCAICLVQFKTGDENITLICNHTFHANCIKSWIRISPSCPLCRESINFTTTITTTTTIIVNI